MFKLNNLTLTITAALTLFAAGPCLACKCRSLDMWYLPSYGDTRACCREAGGTLNTYAGDEVDCAWNSMGSAKVQSFNSCCWGKRQNSDCQ
ncbi:hypothetical protein V8F06_012816 [Rhypophila decipiens]